MDNIIEGIKESAAIVIFLFFYLLMFLIRIQDIVVNRRKFDNMHKIITFFLMVIASIWLVYTSIPYINNCFYLYNKGKHESDVIKFCLNLRTDMGQSNKTETKDFYLKNRIVEMYNLLSILCVKNRDISKLTQNLESEINSISGEIKTNKISYQEAITTASTYHKLCLLQRKQAYKDELDNIRLKTTKGIEEIFIKIDEAYTDLRMIETIGQRETEKLYSEIDNVLNNYSQYATDKTIDASLLKTRPLPEVWQTYINN